MSVLFCIQMKMCSINVLVCKKMYIHTKYACVPSIYEWLYKYCVYIQYKCMCVCVCVPSANELVYKNCVYIQYMCMCVCVPFTKWMSVQKLCMHAIHVCVCNIHKWMSVHIFCTNIHTQPHSGNLACLQCKRASQDFQNLNWLWACRFTPGNVVVCMCVCMCVCVCKVIVSIDI
jgi:hypothetical protein